MPKPTRNPPSQETEKISERIVSRGNEEQNSSTGRAESLVSQEDGSLVGRELDAAAAEHVMGWHREMVSDPRFDLSSFENWVDSNGVGKVAPKDWSPSVDMAAAMQVVEKLRERGWSFACTMYDGKLPYASFCKRTAASSKNAEAELLPEAICKAALAVVNLEVE